MGAGHPLGLVPDVPASDPGPQLVQTVTENFRASEADKAMIAQFVHALGFDPNTVSAIEIAADRGVLKVAVTRRAGTRGRR